MNLKYSMTSREIAELTGKLHKNVLADCEKMFNELKVQPVDFLDNYQDAKGEERKQYRLDRDLTMTLVTKYDTARRYAVVRRWRELEEQEAGRELIAQGEAQRGGGLKVLVLQVSQRGDLRNA
ncbi:Rha family transcriptional regulator [Alteromonas sp. S015]|uniref:Rha family transcriptional regulator n=1 Tax=Alteromonas sp. S015 TaxID=3117401 RepID=UPI002FE11174